METTWCLSTIGAVGIDTRTIEDGEVAAYERVLPLAFGEISPPDHVSTWAPLLAPDRSLAALDGQEIVGGVVVVPTGMTLFAWAPAPWCSNVF